MRLIVLCPYCRKDNFVYVDFEPYPRKQITTCDIDNGGRDRDFVFKPTYTIKVECFKIQDVELKELG